MKIKKKIILKICNIFLCGTHFFELKRKLLILAGYRIGKGTKIVGPLDITTELEVGNNCWIGKKFNAYGNGKIIIGDNCDIAPNVSFFTGTHEIGTSDRRAGKGKTYNIKIENGCWIGGNTSIINEIIIKESSIVGACSLINKNVEKNSLVAGIPAKLLKKLGEGEDTNE